MPLSFGPGKGGTSTPGPAPTLGGDQPAATGLVASYTVVDDGSSTAGWPNRWEWLFRAVGKATGTLVQWVNEYGEHRLVPAKVNTVALRIFSRTAAADPAHVGSVLEVQDARDNRVTLFGVDGTGKVTAPNVRTPVVALPTGATLPADLPDPCVVVRYTP
ncbi:hypothetical protein WDZ16_12885 [Pseudokineococcus marinus]|uniref:Uncharacterized protein n=1 Tax=Pseudokineococcus marinus TaxID=351215 RepID=A0A849BEZ3_9ACTN|nr:hypothetical protein [Pseudokineococcus marinus]NNH21630.1 hypothetical protein [Pseudokineococcus marinus]